MLINLPIKNQSKPVLNQLRLGLVKTCPWTGNCGLGRFSPVFLPFMVIVDWSRSRSMSLRVKRPDRTKPANTSWPCLVDLNAYSLLIGFFMLTLVFSNFRCLIGLL